MKDMKVGSGDWDDDEDGGNDEGFEGSADGEEGKWRMSTKPR